VAIPTAFEQLIVELINRARLDPLAEAARQGFDLNAGLAAGTITVAQKQPLAFNTRLGDAADAHSSWMLSADVFSHTGSGGSNPGQRMLAAGYEGWTWGENIAWSGSTGSINVAAETVNHHDMLFESAGHRVNIMNSSFREIGVGMMTGDFRYGQTTYNALMTTQNFAASGSAFFVTGVVINDLDDDRFYDIGEGLGGVTVTVRNDMVNETSMATWSSGGYSLAINSYGERDVVFTGSGIAAETGVRVDLGDGNVKIDLADSNTVIASATATLLAGAANLRLIGINPIDGTGNALGNAIHGNISANVLFGLDGNDALYGGGGNDVLDGGNGNDILRGEAGADILRGGIGDDTIYADAGDNLAELSGGEGFDTLYFAGTVNFDWQAKGFEALNPSGDGAVVTPPPPPPPPPPVPNVPTAGNDTINGTEENDELHGLAGNDIINGQSGHDWIDGGLGVDRMTGGFGDDTYVVDNASDVVTETAGQGSDTIVTSLASFSLSRFAAVEALTYGNGEAADLNFPGTGNALVNTIIGGGGNDTLNGGLGADLMLGGAGNDTYMVDNAGDRAEDSGGEADRVLATVSYTLGDGIELLTLQAGSRTPINGTGNDLNNTITGTLANNVIDGRGGADRMSGGSGNDTYIVDHQGDAVIESSRGGIDTVRASASHVLSANVEYLVLIGDGDINGTGNGLANTITGNAGDNVLDGGAGIDRMAGGLGDDTYVVDTARDVVTELADQGNDTIVSRLSTFSLASYAAVENLRYDNGTAADLAFTGAGNGLANIIAGGAANDRLSGLAGDDVLFGGAGSDQLSGGLGADQFVFVFGETGADTVTDFDVTDTLLIDSRFDLGDGEFLMAAFETVGADLKLTIDATTSITLKNAAGLMLTADNFGHYDIA
jgi:Ca2+-binding RTX toxin-like protein